jgi:hypothetical protein
MASMLRRGVFAAGATAVGVGLVRWQLARLFAPRPSYQVERKIGELELRHYPPLIEAATIIGAPDFETAIERGFHRLAGYIFGGNVGKEKLAMTTPVITDSERLPMTAPVIVASEEEGYRIAFVMPPGRSKDSLPVPVDSQVTLEEVPARRLLALRFRGRHDGKSVEAEAQRLLALAGAARFHTSGAVQFAGYDPPTTLPFLRRNEVWVGLADGPSS